MIKLKLTCYIINVTTFPPPKERNENNTATATHLTKSNDGIQTQQDHAVAGVTSPFWGDGSMPWAHGRGGQMTLILAA